jgi:hypothetical protein
MSNKGIRNLGTLLGLLVTATVIWYRNSPDALAAGIAFLMSADILCLVCAVQASLLITKGRAATKNGSQLARTKQELVSEHNLYILFLLAWQITILAILSISSQIASISPLHLLSDYASAILYFMFSYRMISCADNANQNGGYKPINFLGYRRSRKLIFSLFSGYCTIAPLTIISLEYSIASAGWRPVALRSSQACLLMAAIMSTMAAGLIYQRYRSASTKNKSQRLKILGVAVILLVWEWITQHNHGIYTYILLAVSTISCAISTSYLWQLGEYTPRYPDEVNNGASPLQSSTNPSPL